MIMKCCMVPYVLRKTVNFQWPYAKFQFDFDALTFSNVQQSINIFLKGYYGKERCELNDLVDICGECK